jgi:hypothetical protein
LTPNPVTYFRTSPKGNTLIGIERTDSREEVELFKRFHSTDLVRRFAYSGTAGDRNQHMMSGRAH